MKNSNALFKYLLAFTFFFFSGMHLWATVKEIGVPVIQNFERSIYNAGTQNWGIAQGANGVMYFGNNNGLLVYNGQFWATYAVPNGSNIRSVHYSSKYEQLFIGAFNEIGFFSNDSIGKTTFTSLKGLLPEKNQNFGDVWRIHETPWGIVFQSFEGLFIYNEGKIETVKPRSIFHFSYYVNGNLYVFDRDNGIMEYRNGFLRKIPGGDSFINLEIWSVLPLNNDEVLFGTAKKGLFVYNGISLKPWNKPVNKLLIKQQIYSSIVVDENHFAFGTIQNGLIVCDKNGNVKQQINREKGLQNNTILSMCLDVDNNLWLGLDNGIDYIELNSPITLLQDFYDFGTGYTSYKYKDNLYFGTNQGLFYCDVNDFSKPNLNADHFKMVENTSGQVWSLQEIDNKLYCGHNNGSFFIDDTIGLLINDIPGCWAYNKVPGYANLYIEGTYNGLELSKMQNGQMTHLNSIKGINYSCQEVACVSNRKVWVSHAFNGVALFEMTPELDSLILIKKYTVDDGLPSNFLNKVKKMKSGEIILTTPNGIYQYNTTKDNFYHSGYYNNLFSETTIQYLQEDDQSNIWYVNDNSEGGVLRYLDDGSFINVSSPFNKLRGMFIGSFFNFNVIDDENVLIALEKGFAHYNPKMRISYRRSYNAIISSVSLLNTGEVLYSGIWENGNSESKNNVPEISYQNNSLRFTFTGLFYEGGNENTYSFFLEGFDNNWSEWHSEAVKEYTNLPDGDYVFKVRSKNKYDVIAVSKPFLFKVLPPWYKSTRAIIGYFILLFIFIWFWVLVFIKRIEKLRLKEKAVQKKKYKEREEILKRETLEAEKEIIRLRNDKLRADMIHKDKELANTAMNLVQKNKHLNKIKNDLIKIQKDIKEDLLKSRISMMIRKIDKETLNDESWSIFETNFEQVHEDFLKRLRTLHPEISPKELKLSAYLRMNMSSKEIATLMNITTRGVEISRYRLRKKFDLERSQNLIDYILSI